MSPVVYFGSGKSGKSAKISAPGFRTGLARGARYENKALFDPLFAYYLNVGRESVLFLARNGFAECRPISGFPYAGKPYIGHFFAEKQFFPVNNSIAYKERNAI